MFLKEDGYAFWFGRCLPQQKNLRVLRTTNMLALLTESLYISNPDEAAILNKVTFIEGIAQGHVTGLVKCFSLRKKWTKINITQS
ncbi:N-acetylmuramoyl-L-alanine amidase [Peribacillus asahii]|uniref:N-acetylmuramoyl-L-alanine amidase n=1 Tax=Peribacillus asahii TaxID=228899 RepID=UPI00380A66A8